MNRKCFSIDSGKGWPCDRDLWGSRHTGYVRMQHVARGPRRLSVVSFLASGGRMGCLSSLSWEVPGVFGEGSRGNKRGSCDRPLQGCSSSAAAARCSVAVACAVARGTKVDATRVGRTSDAEFTTGQTLPSVWVLGGEECKSINLDMADGREGIPGVVVSRWRLARGFVYIRILACLVGR